MKKNRIDYNIYNEIEFEIKDCNGKVIKYYDNGKIKFKGKYLNGKKNGKGKEYDYNGKLKFKGKYLNGERNGNGKEYCSNGIKFKGEYLNGKRWNGKGKNIILMVN